MATDPDTDTLARTIAGEARGEGADGMTAVAHVVINRCNHAAAFLFTRGYPHPLFGDGSPASACKAPWQFSCWNKDDPNLAIIEALDDKPIFEEALAIARSVLDGATPDTTNGATHYYDRRMPTPPDWAQGRVPCATIAHHVFFNNIN